MSVEFTELPPISRANVERAKDPVVVDFLEALKANPGQWAVFPLERKVKPVLPEGYVTATRNGVHYASYGGDTGVASKASAEQ